MDSLNVTGGPAPPGRSSGSPGAEGNIARYIPRIHLAVLVSAVLLIRCLLVGQPPYTDEGDYISMAFHLWHHPFEVIRSQYPISLYSEIFSWLFGFCADGFVAFRLVDAVLAALCTAVFYALLKELSKSPGIAFFLTLVWVLCANHPVFINAGFKNPYAPAFTCIFYALLLLVRHDRDPPVFRIGALLGAAFLFREPLIVFVVPVSIHLLASQSLRSLFRLAGGLGLTIVMGFILLGLLRGGDVMANARNIVTAWTEIAVMFETLLTIGHYDRAVHALSQLHATLDTVGWAVPLWLVGIGAGVFALFKSTGAKPLVFLAGLVAVCPLPEFFLKLGFPFHLSACFAGLSMLSAIGFGAVFTRCGTAARLWCPLALATAVLFFPATGGGLSAVRWGTGYRDAFRLSASFLPVMAFDANLPDKVAGSFYLRAKASIQRFSRPGDSILISGFYGALYPLSGRSPPRLEVTDLTTYAFSRRLSLSAKERRDLNRQLPVLFIETNRFSDFDLKTLFDDFPKHYTLVDSIPEGPWHYGGFACKIYRLRN